MYGDLLGSLGGLAGTVGAAILGNRKAGQGELKTALRNAEQIQLPQYDISQIPWEQLRQVASENPTLYSAVTPESVQTAQDSPALALQQMMALGQARQVAEEGMPVADRLAAQEAQSRVAGSARSAQLAALRDLAERGRLGAGDEIQARLAASQQASTLGRGMASDLAQQSANRRMAGIQEYANQAGNLRAQNYSNSMGNANVINNFNNMVSQMQNQAAMQNAAAQTQAQANNAAMANQVQQANAMGRTDTAKYNQANRNNLGTQGFQNALAKNEQVSDALGGLSRYKTARQTAQMQTMQNIGSRAGQGAGGALDAYMNWGKK